MTILKIFKSLRVVAFGLNPSLRGVVPVAVAPTKEEEEDDSSEHEIVSNGEVAEVTLQDLIHHLREATVLASYTLAVNNAFYTLSFAVGSLEFTNHFLGEQERGSLEPSDRSVRRVDISLDVWR